MTTPVPTPDATFPVRRRLAMLVGLAMVAFWPTLITFPGTWRASYQEHGFFLAGLALWFAWTRRERFLTSATPGLGDLVPVIALLSGAWLLALIMNVRGGHQLAFVLIGMTWAFAIFGWGSRVQIITVGATLALAIPMWGVLVPVLQRMTVIASGAATRLAGIEAMIGYDTIAISTGIFLVEEGCAGINYLMGGLTLGAFYAHLFTDRWQTQLKIVGLAGLVSIVGNWIRVAVLIFLGEATAMQSPYIEDHLWQGWLIFTLLMVPTYRLARRIERRDADAAHARDGAGTPEPRRAGEARTTLPGGPQSGGVLSTRLATRATAAALLGPGLYMAVGALPRTADPDWGTDVFEIHAAWAPPRPAAPVWTPDYQGFDDRADWTVDVLEEEVALSRYYWVDQRQGAELIQWHNSIAPDSLLVAAGMYGPVGPRRRLVRETIFWADGQPRIGWHWYRVGGFDSPFDSKAKLLEILAFFRRSPAAELVTMSATCGPENCETAARALRAAVDGPDGAGAAPSAPGEDSGAEAMSGSTGQGLR
jgi:exosortase